MNNEPGRGEDVEEADESTTKRLDKDTVLMRLPAKSDYLPILRATVGVVAGVMSFTYDEIVQIRVAVSEAFELAAGQAQEEDSSEGDRTVEAQIMVGPTQLEVLVSPGPPESSDQIESRAVIESLVDKAEFGVETAGKRAIRLVKRKADG